MLLEKLKEEANLTNHEKDVARYILEHMDQIPEMSASQLAKTSLTSKATVIRLSQKLGLAGYQEFKLKLVEEINQKKRINLLHSNLPHWGLSLLPTRASTDIIWLQENEKNRCFFNQLHRSQPNDHTNHQISAGVPFQPL